MADGVGEYSNLNNPITCPTRTAAADGGGEDVAEGRPCLVSPPPFKIRRKLSAPGAFAAAAAADGSGEDVVETRPPPVKIRTAVADGGGEDAMEARPSLVKIRKLVAPGTTSIEADHQIEGEGEVEMDLGKSNSIISEKEIEHLCKQMEEMTTIMRHRIKPSAPLSSSNETEDEDKAQPVIDSIIKELADLQGSMSKLKSQLKPFWHKYPYEEDYVAPEEEEKDPKEKARLEMEDEQVLFDSYRRGVESRVGYFGYTTLVSPMHFTHYTPRQIPSDYTTPRTTLQIFSFKIVNISLDLEWPLLHWPLKVYGVVAARDNVDSKCNVLFHRERKNFQEITKKDSFLCLTGPSRAISADRPLEFEVQLKLKGDAAESEDSVLINNTGHYNGYDTHNGLYTFTIENCLCTTELSLQKLYRGAVQATFLRVGIVKGSQSPFSYGGRVACSLPPHKDDEDPATPTQVVLLDSRDCAGGKMPIGEEDGYLDLSRHVVSVELRTVSEDSEELEETLKVVIEAYSPGDSVQAPVMIRPQYCGISKHKCDINGSKVKITIAWSPIVSSAGTKMVAV
ncbi:uncharacterized protein LOC123429442 [Hordeum vulgare subsp. vulgare]|uniref:DUF6598 domain-containing protein n=1 Tax=Hordeum vulgare subsp. vulgare TaxID=112509 RepID=A0A8I6WKQ9_HORVV|nr:uncharacterized protein LOC123429442 [Hordeum vulgare subsp. vulgare]